MQSGDEGAKARLWMAVVMMDSNATTKAVAAIGSHRRPPSMLSVALTFATVAVLLDDASRLLCPSLLALGVATLLTPLLLVDYAWCLIRRSTPHTRASWWMWSALPIGIVLYGSSVSCSWPLRLRFALSRNAFEGALKQVLANQPVSGWVGWYHVSYSYCLRDGVVGFIVGMGFVVEPTALCYDPGRPPERRFNVALGGGWYAREP